MRKIPAYLLICVGILFMFFSLISMYKVFVDHKPVIQVVQLTDMNIRSPYGDMQVPMQNINALGNLCLFAIFMFFVLNIGGKVASVGCNMLKNERIHDALYLAAMAGHAPDEKDLKKL